MVTLFGWTYEQYLFAIGTLRIRPEEVDTLRDIKRIWGESFIRGGNMEPPTERCGDLFDPFFTSLTNRLWLAAYTQLWNIS